MPETTKVVYILGTGRCGSTLLEAILSAAPSLVAVGEVMDLWDGRLQSNHLCGCGQPLQQCEFWSPVLSRVLGRLADAPDYASMRRTIYQRGWELVLARAGLRPIQNPALIHYTSLTRSLYMAIRDVSGAQAVIDTSKASFYAFFLTGIPDLEVKLVHVVRDARGVAYSRQRRKLRPEVPTRTVYMRQWSYPQSVMHWFTHNVVAELLQLWNPAYLRIRYEDLVRDPASTLRKVVAHIGISDGRPILEGAPIQRQENHTAAGNAIRFLKGRVPLQLDDEWASSMRPLQRAAIAAVTFPLLVRYGYALAPRGSAAPQAGPGSAESGSGIGNP